MSVTRHLIRPRRLAIATLLLAGTACGYFNSFYNAQRSFDQARRAEREGQAGTARQAYTTAIEDAASSYRSHRDGRWADDALMLIGRAHYALRDYEASRAAFLTLLEERPDGGLGPDAHAWLGASEAALGNGAAARTHLDSALAGEPSAEAAALARLWRARLALRSDGQDAWSDLDRAAGSGTVFAGEATLTMADLAIMAGDSARARIALARLLRERDATQWSDSIAVLVGSMNAAFGPAFARSAIEPVAKGDWPAAEREPFLLKRVRLAAQNGDTATAVDDALELASRASRGTGARARVLAARLRLAGVDEVSQLAEVRAILLPAIEDREVRDLVRNLGAIDVLLDRAVEGGQPLALFAAAEMARDVLHAPVLARRLFLAYADIAQAEVWAPKALLAAAALTVAEDSMADIVSRLSDRSDNVYSRAVLEGVTDAAAFEAAEQRLATQLGALHQDALREAQSRDVGVGSAVARIDSISAAARADSVRIRCGILIDSLAIVGIRADSVRAGCMRSDSARVTEVLLIDTMMLVDTTAAGRGRTGARRDTSRVRRDTSHTGPPAAGLGASGKGWTPFGSGRR